MGKPLGQRRRCSGTEALNQKRGFASGKPASEFF
jgi:hypothetical protein